MADAAATATRHWAVLIGINFYVKERCLKGSVRDVETVKQHLEGAPTPIDIAILTATAPPDPSSRRPVEDAHLWPTWENVTGKLKRVIDGARAGDLVYIHYSGHGTRTKDSENYHQSGNLALVLFEHNEHGMSYLRGQHLAKCLRKMVEKGLLVTVVLDCCYSGSVLRVSNVRGADVRSVDYSPAIGAAPPQEPWTDFTLRNSLRDSHMPLDQWLVNPEGYTILSACGPHERAWELELNGGERRGALTHFLMEALGALRKSGVELTHQSLYQHLRMRFHASWPQQTPMRYGNENYSFFGSLGIASGTAFVSVYVAGDRLCLSAGEAHGVHKGDEYAVYPFDTSEGAAGRPDEASVMVRVDTVRGLTSDLVVTEPASAVRQIQTGWKARLVTSLSPAKVSVRLTASACNQIQWDEAAMQQRHLHIRTEDEDKEACIFNVALNARGEYEILDGSLGRIGTLPTIPLDTPGAESGVMDVLQHLAAFKYFEGIENRTPSPSFEASFSLLPICSTDESGIFDIKNDGMWGFTVENHGEKPLYLAMFDFTPSWKIINLVSQAGGGDFQVVDDSKEEVRLIMEVPEFLQGRGERQCEDIVKVFVTSQSTSFPSMILPDVPFHSRDQGGRVRRDGDTLSAFLVDLATTFRGRDCSAGEEWATRTFIIRTTMD